MSYFVTGGTGFIGRHVLPLLAARGEPVYVLVRAGSHERLQRIVRECGERGALIVPVEGDLAHGSAGRAGGGTRAAAGADPALLPSGGAVRSGGAGRRPGARQRHRHRQRAGIRARAAGRLLSPGQLDRGRRALSRRLHRGHVRRGRGSGSSILSHQARVRGPGSQCLSRAVAHLSTRHGGRPFGQRRDGQDGRPVLLLQDAAEAARQSAAVAAAGRVRGRAHQPGAGRFRGQWRWCISRTCRIRTVDAST